MTRSELFQGDCAVVRESFQEESIDLVVTSPPYGTVRDYDGFVYDFPTVADQLVRLLKPGGVIVWVEGDQVIDGSESGDSFRHALHSLGGGLRLHDTMIFDRHSVKFPDKTRYHQCWEHMFIFSKGRPKTINLIRDHKKTWIEDRGINRKKREKDGEMKPRGSFNSVSYEEEYGVRFNIWRYAVGKGGSASDPWAYDHPAIFPEKLARDHIRSWSDPGDVVLDPFMGSGTTGKMAKMNGRQFKGIEISAKYLAIAKKRIAGANPPLPGMEG